MELRRRNELLYAFRTEGVAEVGVAELALETSLLLLLHATPRLERLRAEGVTTVEIKSGYGLDRDAELAMLRAARALGEQLGITVRTTYLGAHAVPPEFAGRTDDYVAFVCDEMLPLVARDAVDAFCERIAFSPEQTARVFGAAARLGLPVKLHADQLTDGGGAALAARYGALSADHLEHTSRQGVEALAAAGTVATLLPGAYYFLRETKLPPIDDLRACGVRIALATDCNPGTSPATSLCSPSKSLSSCPEITSRSSKR